jgi:hypothetical protein
MTKKIIVVAPFNTPNEELKKRRVKTIATYCGELFKKGHIPVSALLSGLAFAEHSELPTDTLTWANFSKLYVKGCDEMHVLKLDGYLESSGVLLEIEEATKLGIKLVPIEYELL